MSESMLGNALAAVAGPLNDFLSKLAGSDGEMWLKAFKRFLRKENPWGSKFPVRWTVTLGLHKTPEAYEEALESNGMSISDWARGILKKVTCSKKQVEVHLARATVAELGLPKGGTTEQIHAAILASGGSLCPAEVGPALRLLYKDQSKGEWCYLAMEAISDSDGDLRVFNVGHGDGDLWLFAGNGHPDDCWRPGDGIVFGVPAQVPQP